MSLNRMCSKYSGREVMSMLGDDSDDNGSDKEMDYLLVIF